MTFQNTNISIPLDLCKEKTKTERQTLQSNFSDRTSNQISLPFGIEIEKQVSALTIRRCKTGPVEIKIE